MQLNFLFDKEFQQIIRNPWGENEYIGFRVSEWVALLYKIFNLKIVLGLTGFESEKDLLKKFRHSCLNDKETDLEILWLQQGHDIDEFMESSGLDKVQHQFMAYDEAAKEDYFDEYEYDEKEERFLNLSRRDWVKYLSQIFSKRFIANYLDEESGLVMDNLFFYGKKQYFTNLGFDLHLLQDDMEKKNHHQGRRREWWVQQLREFADRIEASGKRQRDETPDWHPAKPPTVRKRVCLCTKEEKETKGSICVCNEW